MAAVKEISRIIIRHSTEQDLPDTLELSELGYTDDTGRIFIGSPGLLGLKQRAAFPFENLEILTELSGIQDTQVVKTIEGTSNNAAVATSPNVVKTFMKDAYDKTSWFLDFTGVQATEFEMGKIQIKSGVFGDDGTSIVEADAVVDHIMSTDNGTLVHGDFILSLTNSKIIGKQKNFNIVTDGLNGITINENSVRYSRRIIQATIDSGGTGYTLSDIMTIRGGASVLQATVAAGGSSYAVGDTLTVDGNTAVVSGVINAAGADYIVGEVLTVSTGTGTSAEFTVTAETSGAIDTVVMTVPGDYSVNPTLTGVATVAGAGGDNNATLDLILTTATIATITAISSGVVTEVDITTPGNYIDPVVPFSPADTSTGGGGSNATLLLAPSAVFTATNATNILTDVDHPLANGDRITLSTSAADLPNGLLITILYWVVGVSGDDFQVSLTLGGAAVTFSDDGTGTHTWTRELSTAATLTATSVSGGVISEVSINTTGKYISIPTNGVLVVGGSGADARFNLTFSTTNTPTQIKDNINANTILSTLGITADDANGFLSVNRTDGGKLFISDVDGEDDSLVTMGLDTVSNPGSSIDLTVATTADGTFKFNVTNSWDF